MSFIVEKINCNSLPLKRKTRFAAGHDVYTPYDVVFEVGQTEAKVYTNLVVKSVPKGCAIIVAGRSGLMHGNGMRAIDDEITVGSENELIITLTRKTGLDKRVVLKSESRVAQIIADTTQDVKLVELPISTYGLDVNHGDVPVYKFNTHWRLEAMPWLRDYQGNRNEVYLRLKSEHFNGIIDPDYKGDIIYMSETPFERLDELYVEVRQFSGETYLGGESPDNVVRGEGGFGSTGGH